MDPVVVNFLAAFKVDGRVSEWLLSEGITDCESIASIAATEELVDKNFIQPLISAGVESLKKPGQAIGITKLWKKCRTLMEESELKAKALVKSVVDKADRPHTEDQEIPPPDARTISDAWDTKHGFTLTDSQLLSPFQQGKLWREFGMLPKTISFMDARQMRTRSMVNMPTGNLVSMLPGRPLESVEVIADSIERAFELWVRIRAYLYTLSFISILEPEWFPFQAAQTVSEQLLVFMTDAYKGHSPDMDFLIGAWGATSLYFSETTRVQKLTPRVVFTDIGKWQHKWSWLPTPAATAEIGDLPSGRPTPPQHMADNKQLQDRLDSMSGQVKRLQAVADQSMRHGPRGGIRASGAREVWTDVRDVRDVQQDNRVGQWGKGKGQQKGGKGGGKQKISHMQAVGTKRKRGGRRN